MQEKSVVNVVVSIGVAIVIVVVVITVIDIVYFCLNSVFSNYL